LYSQQFFVLSASQNGLVFIVQPQLMLIAVLLVQSVLLTLYFQHSPPKALPAAPPAAVAAPALKPEIGEHHPGIFHLHPVIALQLA